MSPRRKEAVVDDIDEVLPADYESSILKAKRNIESVLGPDVHVTFVRHPKYDPGRIHQVMSGRPRYTPLTWSALDADQKKRLMTFLPYYGVDDAVTYADTWVMYCPKAEWEKELRRKARAAKEADDQNLIAAKYSRQVGDVRVDQEWGDDRGASPPRPRE